MYVCVQLKHVNKPYNRLLQAASARALSRVKHKSP